MDIIERFIKWMTQPVFVPSPDKEIEKLARRYRIDIFWQYKQTTGSVTHSAAQADQLPLAYRLLKSEVLVYSMPIIKESGLERIVLCNRLHHDKHGIGGAMVADRGILYLDVKSIQSWNPSRRAFHHEFFHCIDFRDDAWRYADPDWEKLNERGFVYSKEKFADRQNKFVHRLGFMSTYAMTAVQEDKAELYAHMVINYNCVIGRSQTDLILKEKVARMRDLLNRFCTEYNDRFWNVRSKSATLLPVDHAEIVKLKINKETVEGKEIWLMARQDFPNAKPMAFYSRESLEEFFQRIGLCDFKEIEELYVRGGELELTARSPRQQLPEVWL